MIILSSLLLSGLVPVTAADHDIVSAGISHEQDEYEECIDERDGTDYIIGCAYWYEESYTAHAAVLGDPHAPAEVGGYGFVADVAFRWDDCEGTYDFEAEVSQAFAGDVLLVAGVFTAAYGDQFEVEIDLQGDCAWLMDELAHGLYVGDGTYRIEADSATAGGFAGTSIAGWLGDWTAVQRITVQDPNGATTTCVVLDGQTVACI